MADNPPRLCDRMALREYQYIHRATEIISSAISAKARNQLRLLNCL